MAAGRLGSIGPAGSGGPGGQPAKAGQRFAPLEDSGMTWSKLPPGKEPKLQAGQLSPPQAEGPSPRPDLGTIARRAREAPGALTPRDITVLQRTIGNRATCQLLQAARRDKSTTGTPGAAGLPDGLRAGVERLSGLPMGDVRVHYHSPEP